MIIRSLRFAAVCLLASMMAAAQGPAADPVANPGRPTVSTPAALPPAGYLQLETGFLGAKDSPEFSSQSSFNEVMKLALTKRFEALVAANPWAHSTVQGRGASGNGGVSVGAQAVLMQGEGFKPTVAAAYFRQVYAGDTPDLDIGSAVNSANLLFSGDVRGFHYDTNYLFNEMTDDGRRRGQFGQTLSVSHPLAKKFGVAGEIWHFTQPFLRAHAVGNLWAVNYNLSHHLVLDGGYDHGLTRSSTQWEAFVGFTYLLPHSLWAR
jgi:hypothetical protein